MDAMKEALKRKQAKGPGLTITVGPGGDKADEDKTDLAPKGSEDQDPGVEGSPAEESGEGPDDKLFELMQQLRDKPEMVDQFQQMLDSQKDEDGSQDAAMQGAVESTMTPNDMQDMQDRKPRSLGDRVKQAALSRMKK